MEEESQCGWVCAQRWKPPVGGGAVTKEERRAGVRWERALGQVLLREVRHKDQVISSWERVNECSQVDL